MKIDDRISARQRPPMQHAEARRHRPDGAARSDRTGLARCRGRWPRRRAPSRSARSAACRCRATSVSNRIASTCAKAPRRTIAPPGSSSAPGCRSRSPPNSTSGARCAIRKAPKAGFCIRCCPAGAPPWSRRGRRASIRPFYAEANAQSASVAILQPNVIANVRSCDGAWCRVFGEGFKGYIQQSDLWGVYPNEKIE